MAIVNQRTATYDMPTTTYRDLLIAAYGLVPYESAMARDYAIAVPQPDSDRKNYQDLPGGCGRCIMAVMAGVDYEAFPDSDLLTSIACNNLGIPAWHPIYDVMSSDTADAIGSVIDTVVSANDNGLLIDRDDREALMGHPIWLTPELVAKVARAGGTVMPPGTVSYRILALP